MAAAAIASAQAIDFFSVGFRQQILQTDVGSFSPDPTTPFIFRATLDGEDVTQTNPLTAATITLPDNTTTHTLTAMPDGSFYTWQYKSGSYPTLNDLTTAFPANGGNYSVNLTGTPSGAETVAIPGFGSTLLQAPALTLSGGTWSGGVYVIDPTNALTISFNAPFSGSPGGTKAYHYYLDLNGSINGELSTPEGFIHYDPEASAAAPDSIANFEIVANKFQMGQSYNLVVVYSDILTFDTTLYGNAVTGVALFEISTTIQLMAIPEPSTYAMIFGGLALAGVMFHRRRRLA